MVSGCRLDERCGNHLYGCIYGEDTLIEQILECVFEAEMAGDMQDCDTLALLGVPVLLSILIVELHYLGCACYCTLRTKERECEILDLLIGF